VHLNAKGNDVLTDELEKYLEDLVIMKAQADSFPNMPSRVPGPTRR
jgi:hypothetical protein